MSTVLTRAVVIVAGISSFIVARDVVQQQRKDRMLTRQRVKTRVIQEVERQIEEEKKLQQK